MTRPDPILAGMPRDENGPVFAEPWQAQAFALAVKLAEQEYFTWPEWAETLGSVIKAADAPDCADDGSRYYHQWLTALEILVTRKRLTDPTALARRKDEWVEAYRSTPHGKPVALPG